MEKSIGFIGAGRITSIFLQALKNKNVSLKNISVFDTNSDVAEKLQGKFTEIKITDLVTVSQQEVIIIALHPPVIMETLGKIKEVVKPGAVIISLAPKISIGKITSMLGNNNIVRLIPNATSVINQGYNPVCFAKDFGNKSEIMSFLRILGSTFETEETKLEAYAIASAMLPTYFWFQWNEMELISKEMGLTQSESHSAIYETLKASLEVMYNSNLSYAEVTDLIPVKPIGENEAEITEILNNKLKGLFNKIKP